MLETGKPVALIVGDIIMPGGMTGYDAAEWIRSRKPDLKVLLTCGYTNMQTAVKDREAKVLAKPYAREQLAQALREALDRC